jgi:hypothetical protein
VCGSQTDSSNTCVVVSGELAVYTDDDGDGGSVTDMIQDSIEDNMGAGSFNDAHPDIFRVQYVNLEPSSNGGTSATTGETTDSNIDSQSMVRVGLFAAAGMLVAVLVGLAYRRKKKSNPEDETQLDADGT